MEKPTLICMVGLSGSGKSTKAKELAETENYKIVSTDEIRKQYCRGIWDQSKNHTVFQIFYSKIKYALQNGENVIADATFLTKKERCFILKVVQDIPCVTKAYVMNKPFDQCIADNFDRDFSVPVSAMVKQKKKFTIPTVEEGFSSVIIENCYKEKGKETENTNEEEIDFC